MAWIEHSEYQRIVAMGERVVPLLVDELRSSDPPPWGAALRDILGDGPEIPTEDHGRYRRIAQRWVRWLEQRGKAL